LSHLVNWVESLKGVVAHLKEDPLQVDLLYIRLMIRGVHFQRAWILLDCTAIY
jgi:hypothetical protein